jgi:SAM-dependent methyltransferase
MKKAGLNMGSAYLDFLALFGVGGAHPGGLQLTKRMLSREKIGPTAKILDVGCGTGQTSAYIAKEYGCHVTALDNNQIMIEKAKKRFQSLQLPIAVCHGSAEQLPFRDKSFHMILSESVTAFTDVSKSVPEYKRVLKPHGILVAIEMTREKRMTEAEAAQIIDFYGVKQLMSESEWREQFQKAGFQKIAAEKFRLEPNLTNTNNPTDFVPSKNIDGSYFQIPHQHQYLSGVFKNKLGCRIFRCCV